MENKRQTKGKQRIGMKRIDKEEGRITSFSKRRSGMYKKAMELATLCGTEAKLLAVNQRYNELVGSLEAEKDKSQAIVKLVENFVAHKKAKAVVEKGWWETLIDDLEHKELIQMNESLQDLHKKLCNHINGERARANNNVVNAPSSAYDAMGFGQEMSKLIITD